MSQQMLHERYSKAASTWHVRCCAAILALCPLGLHAAPFPAEIDLTTLIPANGGDGSVGVFLTAKTPGDSKGSALAGGADIDADGLADLVVGAPGLGPCGCAAFVAFGGSHLGASIDLLKRPFLSGGEAAFI